MEWAIKQSSLCRIEKREVLGTIDNLVSEEIIRAFSEYRAFPFFPDRSVVDQLRAGAPPESLAHIYIHIKNDIFNTISGGEETVRNRLMNNARLSSRVVNALTLVHIALKELENEDLLKRRFVLIKERAEHFTLYTISETSSVLSHVGQGPPGKETPSIYLGLNIFDTIYFERKKGGVKLFDAFKSLLTVEERAIETGFLHTEPIPRSIFSSLNNLLEEIIRVAKLAEVKYVAVPVPKKVKRFTPRDRKTFIEMLNARLPESELDFNQPVNIAAIKSLERIAKRYKKSDDLESMREVIRLLVAASGHDVHEVRNRANIILERVLAPKEFDAPIAKEFTTIIVGTTHRLKFNLSKGKSHYFLRVYRNTSRNTFTLEKDLNFTDKDLTYDEKNGIFFVDLTLDSPGHYDYLVFKKKKHIDEWLLLEGCSGRINVIPDIRGHIILEIFPDIHGHTRAYWKDPAGHTGLVYNEHGEVIRIGRFSDISAHLEDLKKRYKITELYLLGIQKRGSNREDWAKEATSPSPFSPISLTEIEPSLGGEEEFLQLVKEAHALDIKIIVDIIPHLNRGSKALGDEYIVRCYDDRGNLVPRAATDGQYGNWNDGKLLNYRKFEVWEWISSSISTLIEKFDIDGIRFDSAHAVPIMMKKNNYPFFYGTKRSSEEMLEGTIIVNDKEDEHFITTGYYDSACRDTIAVPFHYYIMLGIERKLKELNKNYFLFIAECYWGRERYLARTGIIPYNSALFKICENIFQGKTDVREIYHLYDNYYPQALPPGTELLGILGNHDERRALNTFGARGLRAAIGLTVFMSNIIMDYEGSAEGQGWKVFLDNIYVNWNQFEYQVHKGLEDFYEETYSFHRNKRGKGYLIWTNNPMVAAVMKFCGEEIWIGIFNFTERNQGVELQFDNPSLPIDDDSFYRVVDPVYSPVTGHYNYYTGKELKVSRLHTIVPYTERVKFLTLERVADPGKEYLLFLKDSFLRFCKASDDQEIRSSFFFNEIVSHSKSFEDMVVYLGTNLIPNLWDGQRDFLKLGLKRAFFHMAKNGIQSGKTLLNFIDLLCKQEQTIIREIGTYLKECNRLGPVVFLSAEAEPFSKSGGLANVVYELPRELVALGEEVYVITPMYRQGEEKLVEKMRNAVKKYGIKYTGKNVKFYIMNNEYEVGVHYGKVDGINFYLLDHHEFFDGLYWGYTAEEKLRRRIAFARACAELIVSFNIMPLFIFVNDAFAGLFNGIIKADPYYFNKPNYRNATYIHLLHNVGWQYFDSYYRYERGFDHFYLFNLPDWQAPSFMDPVHPDRINCMAAGVRFADRVITVSPSYAKQIEFASDGLEKILHNVTGINNAIARDFAERTKMRFKESHFVETYYPAFLERLKHSSKLREKIGDRYPEILRGMDYPEKIKDEDRKNLLIRMRNKLLLQFQRGFDIDPDRILFSMIHRISEQKGFQLLLEASEGIFKYLGLQGIIGGSVAWGDQKASEIVKGLLQLQNYYPRNVSVNIGFQDIAIPLLCSDVFLMPSMYEPGGISQLEAFSLGCFVVARATGGLRDTVKPLQLNGKEIEGNGVLFSDYTPKAFYDALERFIKLFTRLDEISIQRARKKIEKMVYYWDSSARVYIDTIYGIREMIRVFG
ncbi:MAG: glycogen/starch synthase [Spirochaetota bacterium]